MGDYGRLKLKFKYLKIIIIFNENSQMIFEKEMITFRKLLQSLSNDYFEGEDERADMGV